MMFGWIIIIGLLIYFYTQNSNRSYQHQDQRQNYHQDYPGDALSILKERYARGEIDREEFLERKRLLES